MPKYKHGKVTSPIEFKTFKDAMENGRFVKGKTLSHKSFLAFLYWFGVRKVEALERTRQDFMVKDGLLIVDAKPKKGGEREPLEVPVDYPYVDLITENVEHSRHNLESKESRVWGF